PAQIVCDMVYHTCFGHPTEANALATQCVERSLKGARVLPYALNAAYAQYRIGNPSDAEKSARKCFELAREFASVSGEMHACLLLARLYWSTGRYTESRDWYDKFSNYSSGHAEQDLLFEYDILGAYLKLHDGL